MSAHAEWLEELRVLISDVSREAEDSIYGVCCVADPRDFTPDPEASTDEERERWKADCERVSRGEPRLTETRCNLSEPIGHMTVSGYGLGTSVIECPQMQDVRDRLQRVLEQAEYAIRESEGDR